MFWNVIDDAQWWNEVTTFKNGREFVEQLWEMKGLGRQPSHGRLKVFSASAQLNKQRSEIIGRQSATACLETRTDSGKIFMVIHQSRNDNF